jgi:thioredoxin-like negative regulator of GroEL
MKVLVFKAPWCQPCKQYNDTLDKFTETHADSLVIVDVDNDPNDYKERYMIRSVPTTIVVDLNGEELRKKTGVLTYDQLVEFYTHG